jgi:hypothetical protein
LGFVVCCLVFVLNSLSSFSFCFSIYKKTSCLRVFVSSCLCVSKTFLTFEPSCSPPLRLCSFACFARNKKLHAFVPSCLCVSKTFLTFEPSCFPTFASLLLCELCVKQKLRVFVSSCLRAFVFQKTFEPLCFQKTKKPLSITERLL